ncbi:MAG: hypothetical protein Q4G07_03090 [Oscillospiraceae bacterium]|nr:hypothetical protein [Oscillospiraceae bacterium]
MRLLAAELAKLWRKRMFLLTLCGLMAVNLFLLWNQSRPQAGGFGTRPYRLVTAELQGLSMPEKDAYLTGLLNDARAYAAICDVKQIEAMGGDASALRENYAAEFAGYEASFYHGDAGRYTGGIYTDYRFLQAIRYEFEKVAGYHSFLAQVQSTADALSGVSIFSDVNSYDYRNIQATREAYRGMESLTPDFIPEKGLVTALDFSLSDLVLLFCMLLAAMVLVREERDSGMLALLRAAPAGRLPTAAAKLGAMAVSLFFILLLLYGVNLFYCAAAYGLGDLSSPIQSYASFSRCTMKVNGWQYLGLFLLTKWAAAFVTGGWVMLASLWAKRPFWGACLSLSMPAAFFLIRQAIPAASRLHVLKYANPVSLLRNNEVLGGYRNLYWFEYPAPLPLVEALAGLFFALLFCTGFCLLLRYAPLAPAGKRARRFAFKKVRREKGTTVLRAEAFKWLVPCGAGLLLAALGVFSVWQCAHTQAELLPDEIYYRYYMTHIEGPYNAESYAFLQRENEAFAPLREAAALREAGRLSYEDYSFLMQRYSGLADRQRVFQRILYEKLPYLKQHPGAQLVYESGWLRLFDINGQADLPQLLAAAALCALCFSGLFSIEKGMRRVLCATPLGRAATVRAKLLLAFAGSAFLLFCLRLPEYWAVGKAYGLGAFFAPASSIPQLAGVPGPLPLCLLLVLSSLCRLLACYGMACVTLALSQALKNAVAAICLSALTMGAGALFALCGVDFLKWFGFYPLFHAAALCAQFGAFLPLCYAALCGGCIYLCRAYLERAYTPGLG